MDLRIDTDASVVAARLGDAPRRVSSGASRGMRDVVVRVQSHVKSAKLSGQALRRRTGNLSRAVFARVDAAGTDEVVGVVGADLRKARYGRVQEEGGTIKPRSGKYLTIPIGEALTGNGVARFTARQVIENPSAYGYDDTFFHKGVLFGVKNRYRRGTVEGQRVKVAVGGLGSVFPLFALKTEVRLKPAGYLRSSVDDLRGWISVTLMRAVGEDLGTGDA